MAGLAAALVGGADPPAKIDPAKLVGRWELTGGPKGSVIRAEFTTGAAVVVSVAAGGKVEKVEGTYAVAGDRLTITRKQPGGEKAEAVTITELSDTTLVSRDADGKVETFRRVKGKD
jgi:uncharacterized protein (TIGR03066 family)